MNWRPIATAPKDLDILVFARGDIFVARNASGKTMPASPDYLEWAEYCEERDEYFCPVGWYRKLDCEYCEILYTGIDYELCGWMPLPQLPKELEK